MLKVQQLRQQQQQMEIDEERLRMMRQAEVAPVPRPTPLAQPGVTNESGYTSGVINGHTWKMLDRLARMSYVTGFKEGLISTVIVSDEVSAKATVKSLFPDGFTMGEVTAAMDRLYADNDNLNLPVATMLLYAKERLNGVPFSEIDRKLMEARRQTK
jgi:hypothetical protein